MRTTKKVISMLLSLLLLIPLSTLADTTQQEQYVIISNESVNETQNQNTGSFQKKGKKEAYQIEARKPFDAKKNQNNKIRKSTNSISASYQQGDSKSFWVTDFTTYNDYQIDATLMHSGTKVNVWVNNNQINAQDAAKLGGEFDSRIRPVVEQYFGNESDVDGNGKVNILCYDIKDGFSGSGGYIGGYFYGGDLFDQLHSNRSEIFYIDTYPLMGVSSIKDVTASYDTLAHEFQHMVNFNRNVFVEGTYEQMDVWLDEALSMAAEQIYTGKVLSDRIDYYNYSSSITNGQSLLKWGGDELANYSLSYLFGQYLKIQSNQGNKIFKEIINQSYNDYRAVQSVVKKYINPTMTFGQFMTTFRGALLLKQSTGYYGFKGDTAFDAIQPKFYTGSAKELAGGGAIVKKINAGETFTVPTDKGANISYTFLTQDGDKIAPSLPTVVSISDQDTKVSGKTEANAIVYIKSGTTTIATGRANSLGDFSIAIPIQKSGTKLVIEVADLFGNKSPGKTITVLDKTPPANASVNPVNNKDTKVTGKTEPGARVYIKSGGIILGKVQSDSNGNFNVPIATQKAGTKLLVQSVDAAGNKNAGVTVIVTEKIAVPTNTKATASSYNSVKLSWSAVSGVTGYQVYRSTSSSGAYSKIGTTTSTSYINTSLTTGTTYYYKVRAYKSGTLTSYSGFTPVTSAKPVLSIPNSVKSTSSSYNSLKTTWSAVSGANGYQVYRATSSSGTYTLVGTTTSTSINNGSLTTGRPYYYKIRAYRTVGTKKVYSSFSTVVTSKPIPAAPTNLKASRVTSSSLKLTWTKVTGASGYEISRATSRTGTYSLLKGTTALYYTNTKLTTGKTYYYRARAYRMVGTKKVYSNWTSVVNGRT